jgi:amino acid transporter
MENKQNEKIKLGAFILMIFSSIFGFSNSITAFYQMGYASIIWYVVTAILFFLPSAMMFAEYGATFKAAKGGIFSWLRGSIGEKNAFIGTFIWLAAWVVWLVSSTQFFFISVSTVIYGEDRTQTWRLFGLSANKTLGIMEVIFLAIVTFMASRGINKITKVASVGGIFVFAVSAMFVLASIVVLVANHGQLATPLTGSSLIHSPNKAFVSPVAVVSFIVYALFAYGGMETMAGVTDSLDKPAKTFPRGIIISMVIMTTLYIVCILLSGIAANWYGVLGGKHVNVGNCEYVLVNNLGIRMGQSFGMSHGGALAMGHVFSRFTALSDVLGGLGAAFVMVYSPIKSFIEGCDPRLLPKKLTKLNDEEMPAFAMWVQMIIVSLIIIFVSFGGNAASRFYTILMDMMNVSSSAPYLFLIGAFPFFKQKKNLDRPFIFYKTQKSATVTTIIVWLVIAIGIIFTCIEPCLSGDYMTAFWTAFGPVFFGIIAWCFYTYEERHHVLDD